MRESEEGPGIMIIRKDTRLGCLFGVLAVAFSAAAETIDWSQAEDVQRGVKLFRRDYTEPRLMKAYWFRVDLRTPGLRFAGTERDERWGEVMADCTNRVEYVRTRRRTTADFMREQRAAGRDMIVAFNCSPWTPFCPPWNFRYADPSGLNIVDGVVVSEHPKARNPLFVVWKDGRCEIAESIPADRYADVAVAQSGFTIVVRNGETVVKPGGACHPRMVYGLSRDRRYMYVLAVDGRQKGWALGADLFDLAGMMKDAGAYDAVNMDGGGSTTLVYWNGREPVMVNRHDAARKSVRANGSNLGIWLSPPSSAHKAESESNTWHYRYANDFTVRDEAGRAEGIEVERPTTYSHRHGTVDEDGYRVLVNGAKHVLSTPKLRDFRFESDLSIKPLRQDFEVGVRLLYRYDRDSRRFGEVKFYWLKDLEFCIESDGELVFSRKDAKLPPLKGELVLEVRGTRATGTFFGQDFAFDVPAGVPERGYLAFDTCFSPGLQATFRRVEVVSPDRISRTHVRDWHLELSCVQGLQEPLRYDLTQHRLSTGETEFTARLSGGVMDRGPRIQTGGKEWCSILERLTTPYVRFESEGRELSNRLFFSGTKTLYDRQLVDELKHRTAAYYLPKVDWPIGRTWIFREFPEKFTVAAGYEYAMVNPWRFAENGPWELIADQDGKTVYEGGSLRQGRTAVRILPVADPSIVARVPQDVAKREKALKHAATCGYFSEKTVPSFTVSYALRKGDFAAEEVDCRTELTTVFGDKVCEVRTGEAKVEEIDGGFVRVSYPVTAEKALPVGVYHLTATDRLQSAEPRRETFVFEVLPDDPNGPCPPVASGLPTLYAIPNEIKYLESSALDPWADFAGMGHYYTIDEHYPDVGLQLGVDRFYPLYRRKWWPNMGGRNGGPEHLESPGTEELVRRAQMIQPAGFKGGHMARFDFMMAGAYRGDQLKILADFVRERRPAAKLLTPEGLAKHEAENTGLSKDEFRELVETCWDEFLDYARPRVAAIWQRVIDRLREINPKIDIATGGPYSIYVTRYKSPYTLRFAGYHVEDDRLAPSRDGFYQFEDYHFSCDYPLTRAAYFVSGYGLHYPNGRRILPEIYYRAWTRCNDGAVFQAHPGVDGDAPLLDTHQRRIVYQYCYGTPHYADGAWGYWRGYGFHARNPEKGAMNEMMYAWGKMLKNKPARPLKAPYFVQDLAALRLHGDYVEDETSNRIKGRTYDYGGYDVCNSAEEDLGYAYEQCSAAGYNTPVLTTYADLARLTPEICEFVVLPPVVKGTPEETLAAIRALHARGVNLVCFESAEGLEDLFGVRVAEPRRVTAIGDERFSHKLAVVRTAPDGAKVLLADNAGTPILMTHGTKSGRTAFFALPPTVVSRSTFREAFTWGQETTSAEMARAMRRAFAFVAPEPSVRSERGEVSAVVTEQGDIAVVVNESTPLYGNTTRYPVTYRLKVSAPGIGRMKADADAPFRVISSTDDTVTIRTETAADTGNFFTFSK